jgi:hypothetical protein
LIEASAAQESPPWGYDSTPVQRLLHEEVARRAGTTTGYVDRLVKLKILKPGSGDEFSPGDVLRARWLRSLEQAGVPLEGMAAAVRKGDLSFAFLDADAFDRFAPLSGTTFQQLSEQTGVPWSF